MIEDGFIKRRLSLRDSVKQLQLVSEDITCTQKVEMDDGRRLTAAELQRIYLETAKRYFEMVKPDEISKDIMEKWEYVLDAIEVDPMQLDRELDWVIKKKVIDSYVNSRELKWDSAQVQMLDLQYHNIRTDRGLYYLLEKEGRVEKMVDDQNVKKAMHQPPQTTRAKFRGRFVRLANDRKILCGVNWSYIQLYEPYQKLFLSTDPLKSDYEEASRMVYSV